MIYIERAYERLTDLSTRPVSQRVDSALESLHTFEETVLDHAHGLFLTGGQEQQLAKAIKHREYEQVDIQFPNHPLWIECLHSVPGYTRRTFGVFCFRADYEKRPFIFSADQKSYYRTYYGKSRWRLDFVNEHGSPFLRLLSENLHVSDKTSWVVEPSHVCPIQMCVVSNAPPSARIAPPVLCSLCQAEADFWLLQANSLLAVALHQPLKRKQKTTMIIQPASPSTTEKQPSPSHLILNQGTEGDTGIHHPTPITSVSKEEDVPPAAPIQSKPVIIMRALLIDRYTHEQKTTQKQEVVEHARKFLWMQSAWFMTEALRSTASDDESLRLPTDDIYIELEQPHMIHQQQFAACSFLHIPGDERTIQRWQYAVIDNEGKTVWDMFYEYSHTDQYGIWTVPKAYVCPNGACSEEHGETEPLFTLCTSCQERASHHTSWIAVALRMIAGDFQEQVEIREPEEVLETSTKEVVDEMTGEIKQKPILRRFTVIRYYDACRSRSGKPETKRGSWMDDKPFAESEYEVNPNAIIYVQIQPRDHERTYRHDRYVQMRGKTQHIDPKPRLQPMTIATFRQLPKLQEITKVFASEYAWTNLSKSQRSTRSAED